MGIMLLAAEPRADWPMWPIIFVALVAFGVLMIGIAIAAVIAVLVGRNSSK